MAALRRRIAARGRTSHIELSRKSRSMVYVGTAGWSLPRSVADQFAGDGPHLARYARVFSCAEINTSFYRDHARETYARWAALTPRHFRFAVKLPQTITHENALRRARQPLMHFLGQVSGLGSRLGPLLIQLPPSLQFEPRVAKQFFTVLRECHAGPAACEPRHASWFGDRAEALMTLHRIARVAADPAPHANAQQPGGWMGSAVDRAALAYFRLHGSPRKYWSAYSREYVAELATTLRSLPRRLNAWCVFDNTASGAAAENALMLRAVLKKG